MTRIYKEKDCASDNRPSSITLNQSSIMSKQSPAPQASALPQPDVSQHQNDQQQQVESAPASKIPSNGDSVRQAETHRPNECSSTTSQNLCPNARLRIHLEDVSHPAIAAFTSHIPLSTILRTAITNVQAHLFTPPLDHNPTPFQTRPAPHPKPSWTPQEVRSITLLLRDIDGVAYTTGTDLDEAHKEIHLSLNYVHAVIKNCTPSTNAPRTTSHPQPTSTSITTSSPIPNPHKPVDHNPKPPNPTFDSKSFTHEISGVLTHETVHCFQHNAHSTCPGGLIEGIADYVRMKSALSAPHWKKFPANKDTRGDKWDEGYQKTAWFLEWVEQEIGGLGCVGELNERMRTQKWEGGKVWEGVMNGVGVEECWSRYRNAWDAMKGERKGEGEGKGT